MCILCDELFYYDSRESIKQQNHEHDRTVHEIKEWIKNFDGTIAADDHRAWNAQLSTHLFLFGRGSASSHSASNFSASS